MSALPFVPSNASFASLVEAAKTCRGCDLYRRATQTVFGAGSLTASVMLIGEQPGNDEDLKGRAFVGPAGKLLDRALTEAGIDRNEAYVTNVVKHFKWEPRGKRRLHQRPNAIEIEACLPWLRAELALVRPKVLVCLGATAAQALIGRNFRVTIQHGQFVRSELAPFVTATVHPSSILRAQTDDDRHKQMQSFVADLRNVAGALGATTVERK